MSGRPVSGNGQEATWSEPGARPRATACSVLKGGDLDPEHGPRGRAGHPGHRAASGPAALAACARHRGHRPGRVVPLRWQGSCSTSSDAATIASGARCCARPRPSGSSWTRCAGPGRARPGREPRGRPASWSALTGCCTTPASPKVWWSTTSGTAPSGLAATPDPGLARRDLEGQARPRRADRRRPARGQPVPVRRRPRRRRPRGTLLYDEANPAADLPAKAPARPPGTTPASRPSCRRCATSTAEPGTRLERTLRGGSQAEGRPRRGSSEAVDRGLIDVAATGEPVRRLHMLAPDRHRLGRSPSPRERCVRCDRCVTHRRTGVVSGASASIDAPPPRTLPPPAHRTTG